VVSKFTRISPASFIFTRFRTKSVLGTRRIHRNIPSRGVGDYHHRVAVLVQLLDAPVLQVGNVEEPLGVNGDAPGQVELTRMPGASIVGIATVGSYF
jgi:hypothetical protein